MNVEKNLAISLLKLSKKEPILIKSVNIDARIPSTICYKLLLKFKNEGLVYLEDSNVMVEDENSRLKIAIKAISLGGDLENISQLLCWQEFEEIAAIALKNNGYTVQNNVRFKNASKRWEIDVIGYKKPLVICIDCKHWKKSIASSTAKRIAYLQEQRTKALADSLPNAKLRLECTKWKKAKFVPAVLSLVQNKSKFFDNVPIVPVLQFQDFIHQLPAYIETLKVYTKNFDEQNNVL